ncbi:glycosyltransferase [Ethanoligenens harbinense]|uniref:Glycosyl transferase family 2 n=1 Tax=Ethanoligenens harbinense (strain DSM 18485 / JCM 12961 / CGMCC 1.5033 / YUAN-3) TaxID=663278 RepID=E6U4X1_ETHHY|nr:glycosyltransferase [Ethanoligenens harbinense]ADU27856.1 glycosyl transferase family 2 [Ethanoligenens harbinense YUAN-3]AVQ96879.1 glycosyltransferase family 2 protein [Ethanoligenens harbinense YUAN-3]AYF39541.1 glycosyltransferase family 2 protein [Ethanoligenens harbinense]AYF42366.1 glycosyltransferase family 2 protein [Ethanoligenens harbinense]QCN93119.1 glycosyltransferase family 2 protein [Ethanoligenens harbinense]
MRLVFIAVNYNNCHITINYVANVRSLRNIDKHQVDIVLIDNHSKEEDFATLKQAVRDMTTVKLLRAEKNFGYFGGLNYGMKEINRFSYDYVIVGNNDLLFDGNFLDVLAEKKYQDKQTVIVPDLLTINGIHQNPQFVHVPSKSRRLGYRVYYSCYLVSILLDLFYNFIRKNRTKARMKHLPVATEIFLCTGALMLLRPAFFKHCGLLDDSLFLWGEEVMLAHQLALSGDRMLYDPDLQVVHLENASVGKISSYKKFKIWKKSYLVYKDYYV